MVVSRSSWEQHPGPPAARSVGGFGDGAVFQGVVADAADVAVPSLSPVLCFAITLGSRAGGYLKLACIRAAAKMHAREFHHIHTFFVIKKAHT